VRIILLVVALWVLVLCVALIQAAQPMAGVTLAVGHFGGTDQELQECDFAVGIGAMLLLHPQGEPCVIARELVGRTGRLVFVVD